MTPNQDLLAELELTMVPSPRTHLDPRMYVPREELETAFRARSFWCSLQQQTVEVEFETKSTLGFSRLVGVRRCSAFDEPENVACSRHCLDSRFRRQWPFALPVADRR